MKKRLTSILLTLAMVVSLLPAMGGTARADTTLDWNHHDVVDEVDFFKSEESTANATLSGDGKRLTISGGNITTNPEKSNRMIWPWISCEAIETVVITGPLTVNGSLNGMFSSQSKLTSITGLNYLNTANVTNMSSMFSGCSSLTSLDLSGFNTSNVTDMSSMFSECSSLTSLNLSSFNTSSVTNMSSMFSGCSSLTSLDLSNFNTSNVTSASFMIPTALKYLTLPANFCPNASNANFTHDMVNSSNYTEHYSNQGRIPYDTSAASYTACYDIKYYIITGYNKSNNKAMFDPATFPSGVTVPGYYVYGQSVALPPTPVREGYSFLGWYKETGNLLSSYSYDTNATSISSSDTGEKSYYAKWETIPYSITYDLNGGSVSTANPTSYTVETTSFTLTNPTRSGYDFAGWTGSNSSTPEPTVTIAKGSTGNKTFTANWTEISPWKGLQYAITNGTSLENVVSVSGSTITLLTDITAETGDSCLTVPSSRTVTIDLNGHTIDRHLMTAVANGNVITVAGNLTVRDSGTGGTITGGNNSGHGGGVYVYGDDSRFTMTSGSITNNTSAGNGGGVYVYNSTFNMSGNAVVSENTAGIGGGVYVVKSDNNHSATFYMSGNATISGNTAIGKKDTYNGGGGVYLNGSIFNMNGGSITENCIAITVESKYSGTYGGGVYINNGGKFTMAGGTISGNSNTSTSGVVWGGGVYLNSNSKNEFTMTGGSITGNNVSPAEKGAGGGVYLNDGTFNLSGNPTISGNVVGGSKNGTIYTGGTASNVYLNGKKITVNGTLTGGAGGIGVSMASPGEFTNSADTGYNDAAKFASNMSGYSVEKDGSTNQLKLVENTVYYNVNMSGSISNGTVTRDKTTATAGETITLTVAPVTGYALSMLSVTKNGDSNTSLAVSGSGSSYTFTMPAFDVNVTASFTIIPATAPVISAQPSNLSLTVGYAAGSVSVAASAADGHTLGYQWYSNTSNSSTGGTIIDGAANASYSIPTNKNAGTYYYYCVVTATRTDNSQTASTTSGVAVVTVGKGAPTYTAPTANALTYSGGGQALVNAGSTSNGEIIYSTSQNGSYTSEIPTGVNAGDYEVWWKLTGDANHSDVGPTKIELRIDPKSVTPALSGTASKTYDGNVTASTANLSITLTSVLGDDAVSASIGSAVYGSADVGTSLAVTASGLTLTGGKAGNYTLSANSASANVGTITKRSVTLTSASQSRAYNGAALTDSTVTVGGDGWADGEGASYNVTGAQTQPGSSVNDFSYTLNSNTKAANYEITVVKGTLTVTDRNAPNPDNPSDPDKKYEIDVHANSNTTSFTYDGTAHTVSGFEELTYTFNGVTYTVSGLTASRTETDAGTYTVGITGTPVVKDGSGNDLTAQFIVNLHPGALTVAKRGVTLTSATDTKTYDGTLLTNDGVTVSGEGFVTGEGASYTVTGRQRAVGSSANSFDYTLNDNTKADNYSITNNPGTLTVTGRDAAYQVTVTAKSDTVIYDGSSHTVSGLVSNKVVYRISADTEQVYTVSGLTATATGTDAGSYTVSVTGTPVVTDVDGNDVSSQFSVTPQTGTLTVNKRSVTLTSATDSKAYDGTPLTNSSVTVTGDGWAGGEGAAYDFTGTRTLVGTADNSFTYTLNGNTKADNYVITTVPGTLTVTNRGTDAAPKYEITVTANSGSFAYDGTAHTVSGFETLSYTINGVSYTVEGLSAAAERTDAGETEVSITGSAVVRDGGGNDLTEQFIVNTANGKLTVNKRGVTLTSASDSKTYDGNALTNGSVTVTGDGWASGEGAAYYVTGSQKIEGSSANSFAYVLNDGTKAENYNITTAPGTLTVTSRDAKYEISPQANSGTVKYDGQSHTVSGFVTDAFTVEGNIYRVSGLTATGSGTDAGSYTVSVTGTTVVTDADGNDVSSQFSVTPQTGLLTVSKRSVTLTSATDSKAYDGAALTNGEVTVTGDGWAGGEGAAYAFTGTRTLVGTADNSFTYTLNGNTKADNYVVTTVPGILTVTNRGTDAAPRYEITVTANSSSFTYDGREHTVSGFETLDYTFGGVAYTVSGLTAEATATNAGIHPVAVTGTAVVKNAAGDDLSDQFTVRAVNGSLSIARAKMNVTAQNYTGIYDGAAHGISVLATSPSGAAVNCENNSFTNVGAYTVNYTVTKENYETVTGSGTVTITPKDISASVIALDSSELAYTGSAVSPVISGVTLDGLALTAGTDYTVTAGGSGTNRGAYTLTLTGRGNYTGTAAKTWRVVRSVLSVTAPTSSPITYGQTLSESALTGGSVKNGNVTVAGSFSWVNGSLIPDSGTADYDVLFTPSNTANYDPVSLTVSLTVNKAVPTVTAPAASDLTVGQALSESKLTGGSARHGSAPVIGRFIWNGGDMTVNTAGTYAGGTVQFTPIGDYAKNYEAVDGIAVPVNVKQAARTGISIASDASYVYGEGTLPAFTVSGGDGYALYYSTGTITVDGIGTMAKPYSGLTNTALSVGVYKVAAYFPAESTYSDAVTNSVTLTVTKAKHPTPSNPTVDVTTMKAQLTGTYQGKSFEYRIGENGSWKIVSADANGQFKLGALDAGTYTLYLRQREDTNHYDSDPAASGSFTTAVSLGYNANGGVNAPATVVFDTGGSATVYARDDAAHRPARSGYTFDGWFDAPSGGTELSGTTFSGSGGSRTVYAHWTPVTYTVTFDKNAADATGSMGAQSFTYGAPAQSLSANAFTRPGYAFVGWAESIAGAALYIDRQTMSSLAGDTMLYAVWRQNTYSVICDISTEYDDPVALTLKRGNTVFATRNNIPVHNGVAVATFSEVPPGLYNLVATQTVSGQNIIMTVAVIVSASDVPAEIIMPSGSTNSILEIAEDTRPVIVDGLAEEAEAKAEVNSVVTVAMEVSKQEDQELGDDASEKEIETQAAIESIKEEAAKESGGSEKTLEFMNINVTETVETTTGGGTTSTSTPISETAKVMEIVIPFDMNGKDKLSLYRHHGGVAAQLLNNTSRESGSFYWLDGSIHLFSNLFSTYAFSYEELTTYAATANSGTGSANYLQSAVVTITADNAPDGKMFDKWTTEDGVNFADADSVTTTFTMPAQAVTVTATYKDVYTVTVVNGTGGGSFPADATVTITANAAPSGQRFDKWTSGDGVSFAGASSAATTFTMPAKAVTVTATYRSTGGGGGGSSSSNPGTPAIQTKPTTPPAAGGITSPDVTGVSGWLITGEHPIYLNGYNEDGVKAIRPNNNITRAEAAMIFYRLLLKQDVQITKTFPDVPDDAWYAAAVNTLASLNIIRGYGDGQFHPGDPITRAEFTAIATRFAKTNGGTANFNDVDPGYWAYGNIATAAAYGWVSGNKGLFRPLDKITRAETATIVNRMLGRAADREYVLANPDKLKAFTDLQDPKAWYYYEMVEASTEHDFTMSDGVEKWTEK